MITRTELIAKGFSGDEADAYLADKHLEEAMSIEEIDEKDIFHQNSNSKSSN